MSEAAPRSNSRLDNFDTNKARLEKEQSEEQARLDKEAFLQDLYGNAGETDFSDEARQRVEEADAYERHLESLMNDSRTPEERTLARIESGELTSPAFAAEWDNAIAENEAFDAIHLETTSAAQAEKDAFVAQINSHPELRQLDRIANRLAVLNSSVVSRSNQTDKIESYSNDLEDRLTERLSDLADNEEINLTAEEKNTLTSYFIDRAYAAPVEPKEKAEIENKATSEQEAAVTPTPEMTEMKKPSGIHYVYPDMDALLAHSTGKHVKTPDNTATPERHEELKVAELVALNNDSEHTDSLEVKELTPINNDTTVAELDVAELVALDDSDARSTTFVGRLRQRAREWRKNRTIETPANAEKEKTTLRRRLLGSAAVAALVLTTVVGVGVNANKHKTNDHEGPAVDPFANMETSYASSGDILGENEDPSKSSEYIHSDAFRIPAGGGGEQMMRNLGQNPSDWYKIADQLAKKFPDNFYTVQLENGKVDVRISKPGELPEPIQQYIVKHVK